MKKRAVGNGLYRGEDGTFWVRPEIDGGRTWRKLHSTTERDAKKECGELLRLHSLSEYGTGRSPFAPAAGSVADIAALYLKRRMRTGSNSSRSDSFWKAQEKLLRSALEWWGNIPVHNVKIGDCAEYHAWRVKRASKGIGNRIADMELCALSNVFTFAAMEGIIPMNPIRCRPKFTPASTVRHAREVMPVDGDALNNIAEKLFERHATQAVGWQMLFECMTGCRTIEACRMRVDAKPGEAGYIEGDRLDLQRAKKGIQPWVIIHPELRELIEAHRVWHGRRSPFWFFLSDGRQMTASYLTTTLGVLHGQGLPKTTSHGMRAYFVTKMRRDGISDSDVASMIGDRDVTLISHVYGQPRPGEAKLSWRRSDGTAAWDRWLPKCEVLQFPPVVQAVVQQ